MHWHKIFPISPNVIFLDNLCQNQASGMKGMSDINCAGEKSYGKVLMTSLVKIHVEAQQIVTMPNGSSHNVGRTPNDVAKKRST